MPKRICLPSSEIWRILAYFPKVGLHYLHVVCEFVNPPPLNNSSMPEQIFIFGVLYHGT
jgi:hypothetical protein